MMNNLRKMKLALSTALVSGFVTLSLAIPTSVFAQTTKAPTEPTAEASFLGNIVVTGVQALVEVIVNTLGKLTLQLVHILIMVAGYNGFMQSPAITTGWVIARDVANLFFVAAILIVSIGSIVKPSTFGGAKQVLNILIFAVFVNFSRTIAAIFIDISQLVMLTFVNGFAAAAGGNFVEALGITKLTDIQPGGSALTFGSRMGGLFLALLMFVIITVIIAVMVVALVVRMVTLWMLVVLSPIAFALGSYKGTHEHYALWWKKFSTELTTGPIVAFFLWLSLVSFQGSSGSDITGQTLQENASSGKEAVAISCGDTVACSEESMIRFIVATVMLLAGLSFAQEFGGVGGAMAGSAMAMGKKYANTAVRFAARKAALPVAAVATGGVGIAAAGVAGELALRTKWGQQTVNRARGFAGKTLGGGNAVGNVLGRIPGIGYVGRNITVAAGQKREEMMKDIRSKTAGLNENQRDILFKSPIQPQILKDVIALDIAKDKKYSKAKIDSTDPAEKKRYDDFVLAFKHLDAAGKAGDKDSADRAKEIKEARPDVAAAASGKVSDLTETAQKSKLEDLKKINFEAMGKDNRDAFFGAMNEDVLTAFYNKGSSSEEKRYIEEFRNINPLTGNDLVRAVQRGDDMTRQPAERPVAGATVPPGQKPPTEVNLELANAVLAHGNDNQIQAFLGRSDIDKFSDAMRDSLRAAANLQTGSGFDQATGAMEADNLRLAEASVITSRARSDNERAETLRDVYKVKDDGSFIDSRMEASFEAALRSPKKVDFVMSLPEAALSDENTVVTRHVISSLTDSDLSEIAKRTSSPADIKRLQALLKTIGKMGQAGDAQAQSLAMDAAVNPDVAAYT